jgi:predicted Fe-Mo cluster-binding NifX family protein
MTVSTSVTIAIPTAGPGGMDAERSAHFGHADSFTIVEVLDGQVATSRSLVNPPHAQGGCGLTVAMLAAAGASIAIVVGMGRGPLAAMDAHGMTPLFDDQSPTPRAAVEAYLAGRLPAFGGNHACQGHQHSN